MFNAMMRNKAKGKRRIAHARDDKVGKMTLKPNQYITTSH